MQAALGKGKMHTVSHSDKWLNRRVPYMTLVPSIFEYNRNMDEINLADFLDTHLIMSYVSSYNFIFENHSPWCIPDFLRDCHPRLPCCGSLKPLEDEE